MRHGWEEHQCLVVSNVTDYAYARHDVSALHPCLVCGVGSGVVFPTRDMLCDHLFEHLYEAEVRVPASAALARKP